MGHTINYWQAALQSQSQSARQLECRLPPQRSSPPASGQSSGALSAGGPCKAPRRPYRTGLRRAWLHGCALLPSAAVWTRRGQNGGGRRSGHRSRSKTHTVKTVSGPSAAFPFRESRISGFLHTLHHYNFLRLPLPSPPPPSPHRDPVSECLTCTGSSSHECLAQIASLRRL
jgi:hypothetical protein